MSAPRLFIRYTFCKLHIVNQYNINKIWLFLNKIAHRKSETLGVKYDAKL